MSIKNAKSTKAWSVKFGISEEKACGDAKNAQSQCSRHTNVINDEAYQKRYLLAGNHDNLVYIIGLLADMNKCQIGLPYENGL